ncbi:MAG: ATP-binding cassette domain-containing protein, partial [Parvibaculaceae bacterium]
MREAALEISDLSVTLGGRKVLDGVSFDVGEGEIFGLIGPNGAGKTTLLNCLSGHCRPDGGRILFEGVPIVGIKPDRLTAAGIGRTFQNPELSPSLTVLETVLTGGHPRTRAGLFAISLRLPRVFRETKRE